MSEDIPFAGTDIEEITSAILPLLESAQLPLELPSVVSPGMACRALKLVELRGSRQERIRQAEFARRQFQADTGTDVRIRLAASQAPELTLLVTERDSRLTNI